MQIDMHYYATYAMARAAGIEPDDARIIATSAQFVDDNIAQSYVEFRDGSRIDQEATAHHPISLSNRDDRDQRRVWVPFHFIPGHVGDGYTERLKCRMDSPVVRELRDHHLTYADRGFALHLLGITAHVYADTFSHYGFSGVSSRGNRVDNSSFRFHEEVEDADDITAPLSPEMRRYVTETADRFFKARGDQGELLTNVKSWLAENLSGALGHGSVATLPDRPYLVWSFDYERPDAQVGRRSTRNNPATYLEGCRALHDMFREFVEMSGVEIFYRVSARIWANPVSSCHITLLVGCSLLPPNRKSTGNRTIRTTPTLRGAIPSSRTETRTPNPLLPMDLHYSIRNVHPMSAGGRAGGDGSYFGDIAARVREVLLTQADKAGRIAAWQDAARSGELFGTGKETIPEYDGQAWNVQWEELNGNEDNEAAMNLPVRQFYRAASLHRPYVLRDLLPKHGLIVD